MFYTMKCIYICHEIECLNMVCVCKLLSFCMYDALNFEKVCQKKRECTLKQTLTTDTRLHT